MLPVRRFMCMHTHDFRSRPLSPRTREVCVPLPSGLLLPILGALPDALIIVVSGLGGTLAEAQEQVQRHAFCAQLLRFCFNLLR